MKILKKNKNKNKIILVALKDIVIGKREDNENECVIGRELAAERKEKGTVLKNFQSRRQQKSTQLLETRATQSQAHQTTR